MRRSPILSALLLVVCCLGANHRARACNVPVFRYALERWSTEPYELFVFHNTTLSPDEKELIELLQNTGGNLPGFVNLSCQVVPVATLPLSETSPANGDQQTLTSPEDRSLARLTRLWSTQPRTTKPSMVLLAPNNSDLDPVWSGPLTSENVDRLLASPARRELASRLLEGQSAVWLLLESGNRELDDQVARSLEQELKAAQSQLQLPPPSPDDPQMQAALPLRIAFSILRVSRSDPAEEILVRSLLNGEPDLGSTPVAFPVFGQGRALAAITSADLTRRVIQEASAFITGPCSCEVKDLNPGKDLLLAANWTSIFEDPVPKGKALALTTDPPPVSHVKMRLLLSATALLLLAALGTLFIFIRSRQQHR